MLRNHGMTRIAALVPARRLCFPASPFATTSSSSKRLEVSTVVSMTRLNSTWTLTKRSEGDFREDDYTKEEDVEIPPLGENEILVRVQYVSCDPTQIGWSRADSYLPAVPLGEVMRAVGMGVVEESNSDDFNKGDQVMGLVGFQKYWQGVPGSSAWPMQKLPDAVDPTSAMCIYSSIGLTAYRLISIGKPKEGETVVVTGAAGAVGSLVCQLAKALGCRVVGMAGTEEKLTYLKEHCGVDVAVNYKQDDLKTALKEACPDGVDIYWENVGGKITETVWPLLNRYARLICCGMISAYTKASDMGDGGYQIGLPLYNFDIITKEFTIQGFICSSDPQDHSMMMAKLTEFIVKGKLKPRMDLVKGFDNTIKALAGIFKGENIGKRVVQYDEM